MFKRWTLLFLCAVLWPALVHAGLRLAPLLQNGAVLQQQKPIPVWGWADAGAKVSVTFHGQTVEATASADGRWQASLPAQQASGEGADLVISAGDQKVTLHDVVVGEVWVCSGQSNMEWHVNQVTNAEAEMASANFPLIRDFRVPHQPSDKPADSLSSGQWVAATPKTVALFSGVAYFFARDLHRDLKVPIGLINTSWGGKMIEVFMSPESIAGNPVFSPIDKRWQEEQAELPQKLEQYKKLQAEWEKAKKAADTKGEPFKQPKPTDPQGVVDQHRPGCLFNGMIYPVIPYGIRGIIWYQGEQNVGRPQEYRLQFTNMISDWRQRFGQGDFPFYFVQLSSFDAPMDKSRDGYARLREAQSQSTALPNTGMAVTIDIGTPANVHPHNKQDVGSRLARIAEAKTYGRSVEWSGPALKSAVHDKDAVRLTFDHADGLTLRSGATPSFELAGTDGTFHAATATVEGKDVVLKADEVSDPVAARYAWSNAPAATLFNGDALPASPFRCVLSNP